MQCPACKTVNLAMTDRQGIEIDYCPQCRGVWLDRGELDRLHASFVDIRPGDRYGLDYSQATGLRLQRNGEVIFRSQDARLAQLYFGIWLAPEGLSDELRDALLAER